jgi:putative transposase
MTLDQSALLELVESLKLAEVGGRVRQATETLYQALIDAELTAEPDPVLRTRWVW